MWQFLEEVAGGIHFFFFLIARLRPLYSLLSLCFDGYGLQAVQKGFASHANALLKGRPSR